MNFGEALTLVNNGHKMHRTGWNGSGIWIELQRPDINSKMTLPYLFLAYPDGRTVPWLASQTDLLASDWDVRGTVPADPMMRFKSKSVIVETPKKPHWTQTAKGKKIMAARKRKGK
jgi:hypothetical protein